MTILAVSLGPSSAWRFSSYQPIHNHARENESTHLALEHHSDKEALHSCLPSFIVPCGLLSFESFFEVEVRSQNLANFVGRHGDCKQLTFSLSISRSLYLLRPVSCITLSSRCNQRLFYGRAYPASALLS